MPSLNILALVTDAFGGRGGIAQYNRDFLSSLVQGESAASVVVVPRLAPDPAVPPTGIVQVLPRLGRVAYAWKALRIALSQHFDVVLCGHLYMAPLASLIARLCRARLIVQTHGIEAWPRPTRRRLAAGEAADLILCVSRYTRARVLDWATIAPERVLVVPNTVGEIFAPGDSTALRTAWGLQDKCVLLSVGRMVAHERYKGQDRTIAAIPKLVAAGLDVIYVVLGEGNDRPRLENVAREIGVADRVRFIGATALETLVAAYRMADLFVMPSTGEGFGITFLEAMACGTPAIGLNVAGARDALGDGDLGLLVTETEFETALLMALERAKPDAQALRAAVRGRFGHEAFSAGVRAALSRLKQAA
jgi:phosphatidylinositol alpha-1,6-mannosyltransferase